MTRWCLTIALLAGGCGWVQTPEAPRPAEIPEPSVDLSGRTTYDNRPACEAFVGHVNGLPCVDTPIALRSDLICDASQSATVCDAQAYFSCATQHTRCEGGRLVRQGIETCPAPCVE